MQAASFVAGYQLSHQISITCLQHAHSIHFVQAGPPELGFRPDSTVQCFRSAVAGSLCISHMDFEIQLDEFILIRFLQGCVLLFEARGTAVFPVDCACYFAL